MAKTRKELPYLPYPRQNVTQVINQHRFPAAGGVIIRDEFTDTDNTALGLHTIAPTNTVGASWGQFFNQFGGATGHEIRSNKARLIDTSGTKLGAVSVDAGVSDCIITADVTVGTNSVGNSGLIFRYVDSSNYWHIDLLSSGGIGMRIAEVTGGSGTIRASGGTPASSNTTYTVTLTLSGSSITLESPLGTISHSSSVRQTATRHGLQINSTGSSGVDNYQIQT